MALVLYLLVQIPSYGTSPSANAMAWVTMAVLTVLLLFFPYLPFLNRLLYYLGVHRLIRCECCRDMRAEHERTVNRLI